MMIKPRHIILTSIGTDGDVFPYLGLGAALRGRGHRVTLVVAEGYRTLAESNGLEFCPLMTEAENEQLIGHPDFWHPLKGAWVGAQWGSVRLEQQYELFEALAGGGNAVFVASPGLLAARVAAEKFGLPLASIVLQPWMIQSCSAPPVMPAGLSLPHWAPRPVGDLYWRMFDGIVAALLGA
jgi:rhamnosyltransferase subunit B